MKVVSFFSGLGGLDKGFVDTGYDIIWANDMSVRHIRLILENISFLEI